jgi:hypothetical protein
LRPQQQEQRRRHVVRARPVIRERIARHRVRVPAKLLALAIKHRPRIPAAVLVRVEHDRLPNLTEVVGAALLDGIVLHLRDDGNHNRQGD